MATKKSNYSVLSIPGKKEGECKIISVGDLKIAFRWCPDGMFMMGPPKSQHKVKLSKGFWIMETLVTVGMFKKYVLDGGKLKGRKPLVWEKGSGDKHIDFSWNAPKLPETIAKDNNFPVTCVIWEDAVSFCNWLSREEKGLKMRLPTEAEWEYACRAGITEEPNAKQLDKMAWLPSNSDKKIHPVATKKPNVWGIYDMCGNVWEWCQDWYNKEFPSGIVIDPWGIDDGNYHVARGGSWASEDNDCRPTSRKICCSQDRRWKYNSNYLGFRVVCECEQQQKIETKNVEQLPKGEPRV